MTKDSANALYQHHGTGAVALAVVNYILATNDTNFFERGGKDLLLEIAKFWKSRLTRVRVFDPQNDPANKVSSRLLYYGWIMIDGDVVRLPVP